MLGFASATLSLDAIPIAQEQKVPIIAPLTGADNVRKAGLPVYLLRASYAQELERLATHWAGYGFAKAAIIHYDDEVGNQNFATARAALEKLGKSAVSVPLKRNAVIGKADVDRLIAADTPVIINTTLFSAFSPLMKALRETRRQFFSSSLSFVGAGQFVDTAKADAAGVIVAHVVPYPRNLNIPVVRECSEAMKSAGIETMDFTSLEACMAAKLLTEALKRARNPGSRESLTNALEGLGKIDLGGFAVNLSASQKQASSFVDLSIVGRDGTYRN